MKTLRFFIYSLLFFSVQSWSALPPQFSDCLTGDAATASPNVSTSDMQDIAKVSRVTYCQNQLGLTNKSDTLNLLKDKNIQIGVSLAKTNYSKEDLVDMAKVGSFVLYVDSSKLDKSDLIDIAKAGAQLAVISATSGLALSDLQDIARARSFVYNVNSAIPKDDLKTLVDMGVQVVIRSSQSALSKDDIVEIAKVNPDLVNIMP